MIDLTRIGAFERVKNPPKQIFFEGDLELLKKPKVSIVGARKALSYSKNLTHNLANALSKRGVVVVSGGAMGIDAVAHTGAKNNTIAVLPNGLDIFYPKINEELLKKIRENGLVLSEYELGVKPTKYSFVHRNRLVVALGEVLVVGEAEIESGSMRSVEIALELGVPIYVFAHRIGESEGTNELLKKGLATPIYDIDEFANSFGEVAQEDDELIAFCTKNSSLEACIERFGVRVYEYELEGRVKIVGSKVLIDG